MYVQHRPSPFGRRRKLYLSGLSLALCTWLFGGVLSGHTDAQEGERVESAREAMDKWFETRKLISKEKQEAALAEELLNARVDLVRQEGENLRAKIQETEAEIFSADVRRETLEEKRDELDVSSKAIEERLVEMEIRTLKLLPRLPDAVRRLVQPMSQRIPLDPTETRLSVSERYQYVISVLNAVNKFNGTITMTSEVRTLANGSSAEVATLYLGIGQAYYASPDGKVAGIGTASEEAWIWIEDNSKAPEILDAIAILKNEKPAAYVRLPLELR